MRVQITLSTLMAVTSHKKVLLKATRFGFLPFLFVAFFSVVSDAQLHTYVSALGSDSNPCTRADPCRTFHHAVSHADVGGEVVALDSCEFGPVEITK